MKIATICPKTNSLPTFLRGSPLSRSGITKIFLQLVFVQQFVYVLPNGFNHAGSYYKFGSNCFSDILYVAQACIINFPLCYFVIFSHTAPKAIKGVNLRPDNFV